MKQRIILLLAAFFVAALLPQTAKSQVSDNYDDFGSWTAVQVAHSWPKVYTQARLEYRTKSDLQSLDCWFARATVGYKIAPWLKFDLAYDYCGRQQMEQHRGLASLTSSLRDGHIALTLRERYVLASEVNTGDLSHVLRTYFMAQYDIPNHRFTPYVAMELYTWQQWKYTDHFIGLAHRIDEHQSIDLFYLYHLTPVDSRHVVGIYYNVNL